jgi:endonuclease/exonuclease/phosphatase (EEP) superfamily protein YafD
MRLMTDPAATTPPLSATALAAAWRSNPASLLRAMAKWLTGLYLAGLILLLVSLEWNGERSWATGILLFAPPQILLLPLLLLTPLCLLARSRFVWGHLMAIALVGFFYMSFRWVPESAVRGGELTIVTHNVGQGNRPQFYGFVATQNPDIIAMQDAGGRGAELSRKFSDRHVTGRGEFFLASRFPILHSDFVSQAKWYGRPVAARFELQCNDRPLIIYSVHLPTPRHQLSRFMSGRVLASMFADEDTSHRSDSYNEWTQARLKLADDLAGVFAREELPFLVCGDFNTPDHGIIYHTIARQLTDAHLRSGRGWGLTFPGATRNPLTLHGPWLRIDYAFAGRGWEPVSCAPEPGRRSQHCAVVARFVPKPG